MKNVNLYHGDCLQVMPKLPLANQVDLILADLPKALDNTMGSGSTGVACVHTQRDFIGMELNEKYFEIAKTRIEEAKKEELQNETSLDV